MQKSKMTCRSLFLGAVFLSLLTCVNLPGFAQGAPSAPATSDQQPASAPNIAIGAGDLLNIVVFDTPELTTSVRVNQDGDVNLPVLGLMKLAGMNTIDAAHRIEDELRTRRLILDPH